MKTKNPAAFPLKHSDDKFNPGMTLRDYFAGQVISGILGSRPWNSSEIQQSSAEFAYEVADFLLIERQNYEPKDNR
jgi:hypothetical protein